VCVHACMQCAYVHVCVLLCVYALFVREHVHVLVCVCVCLCVCECVCVCVREY